MSNESGCEEMSVAALARKRRREKLASLRGGNVDDKKADPTALPPKKRKQPKPLQEPNGSVITDEESVDGSVSSPSPDINTSSEKSQKTKKPQLRYDPDVPMSKEEATVWRREQRRKRNRESAAASRQKQRDRISQLEDEVSDWKIKFDEAMKKISSLEAQLRGTAPGAVSPCASPMFSPQEALAQVPSSILEETVQQDFLSPGEPNEDERQPLDDNAQFHLNQISRPA